ncbi:nicotinate (nicotinamide) nucleotide adenylyltransferase [candidate division WOR-1 bacterium RIFOXYA12_FULL_52_29]|uniref:Probable nicotinate-nucleotide adenylyltransferase n=1 Tax=candidate division WOR-1 bacterium RIFOXYC12_FULL_54_18 TaxID=1802584 RepID=A0A1F4T888_UNCSA|nr:MAG: nicotinate (nicotinamide) nucleotide adenylyltransferase [candidate division WOR-1 bacterium RIFOXYA2_FULL_51_19]OGC18501.1 MAG: nicotinate (nicotinamide) nucleotide adenylyltransferase [candidate division WOR-1 bacterium RIFOXYA12_FULL_52_29]OGC27358.1 MAG: nicotinate (nicotinamide) nucleotide adenylyltransferase [candidate division WOR-1 bacterium RIFOXYB2_FULL_45_9]OGC28918.1 MAG: nicotinate (nicotinamide) nucleotide adenylyltransferase [candidate division WOR-1 bacterium RIFOXYC12_FU
MKRIGIMGGTFNPIHRGHLALAAAAKKVFRLERIVFIPSGTPPHKKPGEVLDKESRYRLVKMAIRGRKNYYLSRIELDRPGYSYAIDTFVALKKKYRNAKLYYIMGLDSINEVLSWRKPLELFKMCEFIIGTRPGSKIRSFRRLIKFPPLQKEADKLNLIELKEAISASDIRQRIKEHKAIGRLVPKVVAGYIIKNGLYKDKI